MLEIVSIAGIFVLSLILILWKFELALYLLLILSVFLHKELFSFYQWDMLPVRIFDFALLASLVFSAFFQLKKYKFNIKKSFSALGASLSNPFILLMLGSWIVYFCSLYFSLNLKASLLLLGFYTTICALVYKSVLFFKKNPDKVEKYLKFYIFVVFGLTILGFLQLVLYLSTGKIIGGLWNIPNNIPRVGSLFWDVNHYGALLALVLPVSSVYFLTAKTWKNRVLFFVVSVFLTAALLLTNSRTAWIIDAVALMFFSFVLFYRMAGVKGFSYLFGFLLLITIPFAAMYADKASPFRAAVKGYFHYRMDSFDSHMLLLQGAFEIFQKYPILGGGYGGFFEHFSKTKIASTFFGRDPAAFNTRVPAHTIWGELFSGSGILGFTLYFSLFILIFGSLLYGVFWLKKPEKYLLALAMASSYLGLQVAGIFYSYNSEFFWIITLFFFAWSYKEIISDQGYTKILNFFSKSQRFPLILLVLLSGFLIFWSLDNTSLIPWDEAIYAKIAKNMYQTGDYLNMHWKPGLIWYEKPPLYMWLTSLFMDFLGFGSLAPRLPSAIFGFGTILLVYFFAKKYFGKIAGFVAALSLLTTTQYLYYARTGMLDVTLTFFITASLMVYYNSLKKKNIWANWIVCGLLIGLATMVKGFVGLLPLPIIFTYDVISTKKIRIKEWFALIVAFLLVSAPWHYIMYLQYGNAFFQNYFGYHVLDRALTAIEDKGKPFYWYFVVMKVSMRIWFVSLIPAFVYAIYRAFKKEQIFGFLLLWLLFIFVFFSAAQSKLIWYIMPVYPVAAIINGYFISKFLHVFVSKYFAKNAVFTTSFVVYLLTVFSLFYLTLNYKMVFPGNLTGAQARLMEMYNQAFGTRYTLYLDRIEAPLALYYVNSSFEIIDFVPDQGSRVPDVKSDEPLILLTKKGRYAVEVEGYSTASVVIAEDGDYILWYLPPEGPSSFKPPVLD